MSHSNLQSTCNPSDLIFHYRSPVPPDCIKLPMIFWFTVFLLSLLLFCTRIPSIHSTHFLIFIFCLRLPFVEQILRKSWSKAGRGGGKAIEWQKEMWSGIRVPDCNSIGSPGDCGIGQTASKLLHRQGQTRLTSSQLPHGKRSFISLQKYVYLNYLCQASSIYHQILADYFCPLHLEQRRLQFWKLIIIPLKYNSLTWIWTYIYEILINRLNTHVFIPSSLCFQNRITRIFVRSAVNDYVHKLLCFQNNSGRLIWEWSKQFRQSCYSCFCFVSFCILNEDSEKKIYYFRFHLHFTVILSNII